MCTDDMEKTEFTFAELSESAKEKAHQEWAQQDIGYEWWDSTYDHWKDKLSDLGIEVDDIYFSGFCSQGDGACFTGRVRANEFIRAHATKENGLEVKYHALIEACDDSWCGNFSLRHSGHYYHSNSVDASDMEDCRYAPSTGFFSAMDDDMFADIVNGLLDEFETFAMETCREYMDEIYNDLEEEYEYLTSMESFEELAEINEWLFNEDGEMI